jgi:hypothetical protein
VAALAWWTIAAANVLAALAMGAYLWRAHPELRAAMERKDLEQERAAAL